MPRCTMHHTRVLVDAVLREVALPLRGSESGSSVGLLGSVRLHLVQPERLDGYRWNALGLPVFEQREFSVKNWLNEERAANTLKAVAVKQGEWNLRS